MEPVRVAVVQDASVVFNRSATLDKVSDLTARASARGAKLVLFPEAFVSAYPEGLDFGIRPGSKENFRRYFESAIEVPSPDADRLAASARDQGVYLAVGAIERGGSTLYCSVLFFGPDGRFLGRHRKLMPTAWEKLVWGFGDGSTLPVFETPLGRIGSVICWENYMPLLRMHMYSQGVQIYLAPTADCGETWLATARHIALEGRCFVLTCCQYLTRGDCPPDYAAIQGDDPATVLLNGGSAIVDPMGRVLAGPDYEGPCILTADLDLDEIPRGKFAMDVVGHYARPDVFRLYVNQRPNPPVVTTPPSAPEPF